MQSRLLTTLVGLLAAVVAVTLAPAGANSVEGTARHGDKPVYWIDLGGQASQHPDYVFFTASAGGYMEDVTWTDWGHHKTVGRGTFGTTAPCNPDQACPEGPAKIVMRKPVKCTPEFGSKKGKKVRVYRHATIWYPDGEGGTTRADITDRAGWTTCKQAG